MKIVLQTLFFICIVLGSGKASDFLKTDEYWKGKAFYLNGNFKAAYDSWITSAEQGIPEAQFFVAGLLHAGKGVKRDFKTAIKWYRMAAQAGFSPAQLGMGNMIADGLGVKKDYIEAHMWFNIASANGHQKAQYNLKKIEQRMTTEEIQRAQILADLWLKKYPQKL